MPSTTVANAIPVLSFLLSNLLTTSAATGVEKPTPIDKGKSRFHEIWLPANKKVRKPAKLTNSSENVCIETATFSFIFIIIMPVVTIGPKPLPLIPLLNDPKKPKKKSLIHEKLALNFLFSKRKSPRATIKSPIYRPKNKSDMPIEKEAPMKLPITPTIPINIDMLKCLLHRLRSTFLNL